jgi:hypothetical protein
MLVKGPIVLAMLLPGRACCSVAAPLHRRSRQRLARMVALDCVACDLWVVGGGGIASMPGFYEQVVLKEFAGRFGETVHRPQPSTSTCHTAA